MTFVTVFAGGLLSSGGVTIGYVQENGLTIFFPMRYNCIIELRTGADMEIQLGLFEAILDLLFLRPLFFVGLIFIGISLYWFPRKDNTVSKIKTVAGSILMYYFLGILLRNVVGIP